MPDINLLYFFIPTLFIIAFLYASVGHGGASGYLVLMTLFSFNISDVKSSALILNILVSFVAFYQYSRGDFFNLRLFMPFVITSIPAAFIGTYISLDVDIYKNILGVLLLFPIMRLLGLFGKESNEIRPMKWTSGLIVGALIGLLSGMIGIGGGIILSPVILLMRWGNIKQAAAVSALFIFVNSISGLSGMISKGITIDPHIYLWLSIAFCGGLLGSYVGRASLSNKTLQTVLAVVLIIASIKLLKI